ncbi:hypothetical protein [Robbsia andropogonis]|uniref:hypothetical protein n=1 Tax=Robbsia andropogonis TaxID=28092 RepID=UPI0012FC9441|nr:hypothetical protein [Robbsia andropogonis]MCP1117945.1 hypothetical protein [Robbsia andropogonis]MCP1127410.1 hypothetical protein [Robbsia andropogonis]
MLSDGYCRGWGRKQLLRIGHPGAHRSLFLVGDQLRVDWVFQCYHRDHYGSDIGTMTIVLSEDSYVSDVCHLMTHAPVSVVCAGQAYAFTQSML